MTPTVRIQRADLWPLLLSFIRYALPRHSYAVCEARDFLDRYAKHLEPWQRGQIAREIREVVRFHSYRQCEPDAWLMMAQRLDVGEYGPTEARHGGPNARLP